MGCRPHGFSDLSHPALTDLDLRASTHNHAPPRPSVRPVATRHHAVSGDPTVERKAGSAHHRVARAAYAGLFEYEASPWCRRVRETLCVLGLPALIRPCPRETLRVEGAYSTLARHKPGVKGRLKFPYLVDHTADVALNDSRDIVEHLWNRYGDGVERPRADALLNGGTLPRLIDFGLLAGPSGFRPWAGCGLTVAPRRRPPSRSLHGNEPDRDALGARDAVLAPDRVPPRAERCAEYSAPRGPKHGLQTFGAGHACRHVAETYAKGALPSHWRRCPSPTSVTRGARGCRLFSRFCRLVVILASQDRFSSSSLVMIVVLVTLLLLLLPILLILLIVAVLVLHHPRLRDVEPSTERQIPAASMRGERWTIPGWSRSFVASWSSPRP